MFDFFDPRHYPYASKRNTVYAKHGMVATSQPLAAQAGLEILQKGGNAVDAAIATAACLTVVEPTSNGIGGDAFAMVWMNQKLHGLNASGWSPKTMSLESLQAHGYESMPRFGFAPVMVPGIPSAWAALSKRFGKLTLLECLAPAIRHAQEGYPLSPTLAHHWKSAYQGYQKHLQGSEFQSFFDTYGMDGKAPEEGQIWSSPTHAKALRSIGETYAQSFYQGEIAKAIDAYSKAYDGWIQYDDLAQYQPEWVDPISIAYRGFDVWEIPPNGQGIAALEAIGILDRFDVAQMDQATRIHTQIEAMKLAFKDAFAHVGEPRNARIDYQALLQSSYLDQQAKQIHEQANRFEDITPYGSGTVYLASADQDGNMVSYIQSNYMGFGSGLVVPGWGIALQNRGHNFSMDPLHPNVVSGRKRSYHTIIPGFLTKNGRAVGPFGVMGGFMQPQGHLQVISNTIDLHLNPQSALDAPRWQWMKDQEVLVEEHMPLEIVEELTRRGHDVSVSNIPALFGRGQIIWRDDQGVYAGGTEMRADGQIACD